MTIAALRREKILAILRERSSRGNLPMTVAQIVTALDYAATRPHNKTTVRSHIAELVKLGQVERAGRQLRLAKASQRNAPIPDHR